MVVSTVVAMPLPATTATVTRPSICIKETTSIGAGGATTYSWSNGSTSQQQDVTPLAPVNYTVTGTTGGCSKTAVVTVQVLSCTGIVKNGDKNTIVEIYPNPSTGEFIINSPFHVHAVVYDLIGKIVYEKDLTAGSHKLDLTNFASGKYLLKTTGADHQQSTVLIKQ
jgi:hypothetical protein